MALGTRGVAVLALLEALASLHGLEPSALAHAGRLVPAMSRRRRPSEVHARRGGESGSPRDDDAARAEALFRYRVIVPLLDQPAHAPLRARVAEVASHRHPHPRRGEVAIERYPDFRAKNDTE
jgi:hypothetical protein